MLENFDFDINKSLCREIRIVSIVYCPTRSAVYRVHSNYMLVVKNILECIFGTSRDNEKSQKLPEKKQKQHDMQTAVLANV